MTLAPQTKWTRSVGVAALIGIALAAMYGALTRGLAERGLVFDVMSVSFLFAVPAVIGALSVLPLANLTLTQAIVLPTVSSSTSIAVAMVFGWEGLICVAMALLPAIFVAMLAGLIVWFFQQRSNRKRRDGFYGIALLPFVLAPLEQNVGSSLETRVVRSEIEIAATPEVVWEHIVEVPTITAEEHRPALFTAIGFPRPISAFVDRRELGGVREARFEGGVLFLERITRFEPARVLEFEIDAQEHLIPPTTLDPHVTIGGPYFDVLLGRYTIEPRGDGVVLHLESELRVSTHFNFYAGAWADLVMASIQDNILEVIRARAERIRG